MGAGVVGSTLAQQLAGPNNNIAVIERNSETAELINGKLDVFVVAGNGCYPEILVQAGIKTADMIIAVSPDDEANLVVCNIAEQFGVPKRIARIRAEEYTKTDSGISLEKTGVTLVVQPENEVVKYIMQLVELPGLTQTANLQSDSVCVRGYVLTENTRLANVLLRDIDKLEGYSPFLIVAVIREGNMIIPTGDVMLLPGDEIIAVLPRSSFESFKKLLGMELNKLNKVIVYGNSLTAERLVEALKTAARHVILVDPDETHGREVAAACDHVEVLHGDCTSADLLHDIRIKTADFFVAAGPDSEDNIMSALMAKAEGAGDVAAIRDDSRHINLFESMGLSHVVVPRKIMSEKILESIHMLPMDNILKLKNVDFGFANFDASAKSPVTGKPLKTLDKLFQKEIVVAAVIRNGEMIVPNGDTVIMAGDRTLVLCARQRMAAARKLF